MAKRMTTQQFIEKAKSVHGDRYDYTRVIYLSSKSKVIITCVEHGDYQQQPTSHLMGYGCARCAGVLPPTTEEFIQEAKNVHGDTYDYSKVEYENRQTKVKIYCRTHGQFLQSPAEHIMGYGCQKCGHEYNPDERQALICKFLERCEILYKGKYLYHKMVYTSRMSKINIVCMDHGDFEQTANDHASGHSGCPGCRRTSGSYTKEWIERAIEVHNGRYDYSITSYSSSKEKLLVNCRDHGHFSILPNNHLAGGGCPKCSVYSQDNFITDANLIHGNKYDYSNVEYVSGLTKVKIKCPTHGLFCQTPNSHTQGSGCPSCSKTISKPEVAWLDSLNIPDDPDHRQVPIRISSKLYRVDGLDPDSKTVYEFHGDFFHGNPAQYRPEDVNPVNKKTFGDLYRATLSKTETLEAAGYRVVWIWESDWLKSNP